MNRVFKRFLRMVLFILVVIFEIVLANIKVAHAVLSPRFYFTPALVKFPLDCKNDFEITLLANIISLTPGTLTLEINKQNNELLIHTMFLTDRQKIIEHLKKRFEYPIIKIFS